MSGKKILVLLALTAVLAGGGLISYFMVQSNQTTRTFSDDGYVLLSSESADRKQAMFPAGGTWRKGLSGTVVFQDVQGATTKVERSSFVHYNNRSIAAMTDGVVVSLDNIKSAQVMNHYAVSNAIVFNWNGSEYELGNAESDLTFRDYIWKLAPDKYMVRASDIKVHFGENDERPAGSYIEVSYVDNGVIRIQTEENLWQTISDNCYATLDNGETVNLSLRNVSDAGGNVLIDFSKIVLNSEDNIEITPLTEALENLTESVIPHFDITAKNGKKGAAGQSGALGDAGGNGGNGAQGSAGSAGSAGTNGSAGKSGTNGSAGYSGFSGSSGSAGSGASVPGTVLDFPTFQLANWKVTATSCSGTIMVTNSDMLNTASDSTSAIYLIDMSRNTMVQSYPETYAFTENAEGFPFSFSGLIPDHNYRLVVAATINTGLPGAVDYLRDFVSKPFWTDSVGVYLEAGSSTVDSVSGFVQRQDYAPGDITSATVYFFENREEAYAATAASVRSGGSDGEQTVSLASADGRGSFSFDTNLSRNTTYYARVVVTVGTEELMPAQVLRLNTLKRTATLGAPTITPNRDSWGFDLAPGAVYDPDGGITEYTYYLCAEGSSDIVWSFKSTDTRAINNTITVPLDNDRLKQGIRYEAYTAASFNDNEKTFTITSAKSSSAQVNGSRMPYVYFAGTGTNGQLIPTAAADSSAWYDQIVGELIVAPGVNSAHAVLTATQPLEVVIRASGYYYAKYPVYLKNSSVADADGTYLWGEVNPDKSVSITLPADAFKERANLDGSGAVYGLRPNTQYQMIVTGNLADEGDNAFEYGTRIGSCVVKTPDTVTCRATWRNAAAGSVSSAFSTTLTLAAASSADNNAFKRQMKTLTSLKLTLRDGLTGSSGAERAAKTLTQSDFKTTLGSAADGCDTLGELMERGLTVTENFFDLSASSLRSSSVNITLNEVYDYTTLAENRTHQNEYASTAADDLGSPGPTSVVYRNLFDVENGACDIQLSSAPDEVPADGEGFLAVTGRDEDGDGRFNDGYVMTPNYLNSGKLAKTVTFYAFDAPDFYASYPGGEWHVSTEYGDGASIPLCAVTAVNGEGKGKWLGSVKVNVPSSAAMPSVHFVPQTKEAYYGSVYDAAEAAAAVSAYVPGTTMDRDGNYLYFFDDNHSAEPKTGHQFIFAWTLTYRLEGDDVIRYYPFSMPVADGSVDPKQYIPHSKEQDSPRGEPVIYALPHASSSSETTWGVYVYDPDGCVLRKGANEAEMFLRTGAVSGSSIGASGVTVPVYDAAMTDAGNLLRAPNLVTIPTVGITGSASVALRAQWYTDVYTADGGGIFKDDGEPVGYTEATRRNSKKSQLTGGSSYVIPYYENLFTFYNNAAEYKDSYDTSGVSIVMKEEYTDGSSGTINGYRLTVTAPTAVLAGCNGIRITFTDSSGGKVSVDEYLEGVDGGQITEDGSSVNVSCKIYISRELADFAGKTGVSAAASLLYENGSEGFSYCTSDKTVSLRSYSAMTDTSTGWKSIPNGRYMFSTGGNAVNRGGDSATLPLIGSFFHISPELSIASETGALTGNMRLDSTRSNAYLVRSQRVTFDPSQRLGAYSGTLALAPRLLAEAAVDDFTVQDAGGAAVPTGAINVPDTIPVITYISTSSNANSITVNYTASASRVWFLLEKKNAGNERVIQRKLASGLWTDNDTAATNESPNAEVLTESGGTIEFSNLDANTTYYVTGYYMQIPGVYRKLNMYNSNGAELANYTSAVTYAEPVAQVSARYGTGARYSQKRILISPTIARVANFYYTTELQDESGNFISYLNSEDYRAASTYVYEVGSAASTFTDSSIISRGLTYKSTGYDTATHTLIVGGERIYLETGKTYRVRVRIYDVGKGPAYGGDTEDDLIRSAAGIEGSSASFTVSAEADGVNMTGTYRLEGSGSVAVPTIAFTPAYINKSMTIREGKLAVAVVRARPTSDGFEYTDVTAEALYAEDAAGTLSTGTILWGTNKRIRLTQSADDTLFNRGDTFTCYLYGIRDDGSVNTGGMTGADRTSILAGRSLADETLGTAAIPVNHGSSVLLATQTVTYTSEQTSAGRVTVTKEGDDFKVLMENPVRQTSIVRIGWSITLTYELNGETGQLTTSSAGSDMEPVAFSLEQVGTNVFQTVLSPRFADLPDGAEVDSYTVTLQFYQAVTDGEGNITGYSTEGIEIMPGSDTTVSGTADSGMRLTSVVTIDSGTPIRAMFMRMMAPRAAEQTPVSSEEPTPTAEAGKTETPEPSETPGGAEKTETPEPSAAPDSGEKTETPEPSETPDGAEKTETPEPSAAPESGEKTETPEPSAAPESGEKTETPEPSAALDSGESAEE